ncbi:glycosyltransferase [Methylobacterium sp. J-026]|uniref:glycosyltransferase n=1 Tax=Methylobacterium sp. J-026 TaxID=2836624 RepID=UPI001FBA1D7F|nr:glycosyltransferase [Methylobacterium sp. J-026]MCJ2135295.1 glycosyltransferase [Methylobacterium sp. J-026]
MAEEEEHPPGAGAGSESGALGRSVDPAWYLARYEDVAQTGTDAVEHFVLYGHAEGRFPNAAFEARDALDREIDAAWYAERYPDVAASGLSPGEHYARVGRDEGRFPGPEHEAQHRRALSVDAAWYLTRYGDVAETEADPGEHYALYGHTEGRFPNAEAEARHRRAEHVDAEWYRARYPDIAGTGLDAAEHYAVRGYAEGRYPNAACVPIDGPVARPPARAQQRLPHYPLVGVVTPVRNRRKWTLGFAQMLGRQDYPVFRLYVVDSASTDGTPDALRALGLPEVSILDASDAAYWTAATNLGVARALQDGCEYILTINDDAIVPDDYVTGIVHAAVSAAAEIVGSVIAYVEDPGRLWGVGAYNAWRSGAFLQLRLASRWDDAVDAEPAQSNGLIAADYLCGNGTLIHRSVFERIGLYDAKATPHYHADSEFTMRAERAGIPRWIAPRARLYNRFTETGDGIFAARNQRLFSLRSANYARPLLSILDRYCPPELVPTALVRYFAKHVERPGFRTWSRLLRSVAFLRQARPRTVSHADFFPPLEPALCAAEDVEILLGLPDDDFVVMLYPVILRRAGSDREHAAQAAALRAGRGRAEILSEALRRAEVRARPEIRRDFLALLLRHPTPEAVARATTDLTDPERWLLQRIAEDGRRPSRALVRARSRAEAAARTTATAGAGRLTVYMNVDVPCMAVTDPKAATGVHRYVVNVLDALLRDPRVDLRLFHAPELAESGARLRDSGALPDAAFLAPGTQVTDGVAFYPYFPYAGLDPRLRDRPHVLTICDVFPLTDPDWFSPVAVANFRRQLHNLVRADHVLCISKATEDALHAAFPTLRAASSVAHLGVDGAKSGRDQGRSPRAGREGRPYFVCVGTIEPRKNLRTVIAAMARLTDPAVRDLEMVVVGQEGWSVTSHDLTALAGRESQRIRFLGRVPDAQLWDLYANAVCTVFPSLAEGFGFPIVESFACGTPVVTSDRSSMREIARAGAVLVDPLDPTAIAGAITAIATDPALRRRLAAEAEAEAARFTWAACAERHVEVFAGLAAAVRGAA